MIGLLKSIFKYLAKSSGEFLVKLIFLSVFSTGAYGGVGTPNLCMSLFSENSQSGHQASGQRVENGVLIRRSDGRVIFAKAAPVTRHEEILKKIDPFDHGEILWLGEIEIEIDEQSTFGFDILRANETSGYIHENPVRAKGASVNHLREAWMTNQRSIKNSEWISYNVNNEHLDVKYGQSSKKFRHDLAGTLNKILLVSEDYLDLAAQVDTPTEDLEFDKNLLVSLRVQLDYQNDQLPLLRSSELYAAVADLSFKINKIILSRTIDSKTRDEFNLSLSKVLNTFRSIADFSIETFTLRSK